MILKTEINRQRFREYFKSMSREDGIKILDGWWSLSSALNNPSFKEHMESLLSEALHGMKNNSTSTGDFQRGQMEMWSLIYDLITISELEEGAEKVYEDLLPPELKENKQES